MCEGGGVVLGAGVPGGVCVCSSQCHTVLPPLINLPDEEEAVIIIKAVAAGLFFSILM